jgi:steroid 5-alpha reductase family enzyme
MTFAELAMKELILLGVVLTALTGLFFFSKAIKNAGIIDVFWAASFGLISIAFAITSQGLLERKILLLIAVLPWSFRLTYHLFRRVAKEHPHEDSRYAALRSVWGDRADIMMYLVFLFQGALITILSPPFLVVASDGYSALRVVEVVGAAICLAGTIGESIADEQLRRFKLRPENKGKVCSQGFWNYSRHPNYFFEFVVWVGIFVLASSAPLGLYTAYCPLLMLFFLTKMTGIKITEEQSLKSRGEEYRRYQQTTSAFFPWFKKSPRR